MKHLRFTIYSGEAVAKQHLRFTIFRSRITVHCLLFTVYCLLLTAPLHAQEITPQPSGTICFFAFDDLDQDGRRDAGETIKAGVNIVISTAIADILDYDTDGSEPFCVDGLAPGDYLVTHIVGFNEVATTNSEQTVTVSVDETVDLAFGSFNPPTTPTPTATGTGTPLPTLPPLGPTATPDPEGIIYVEVFANDTLTSVAVRGGITVAQLLELNSLDQNAFIFPGQRLIVGFIEPTPTDTPIPVTPTPSATRLPPTPTNTAVPPPRTTLCLLAFDDANGNGVYEPNEGLKTAVAFTIFNDNAVVGNLITDGQTPAHCLDLEPGTYQVTRSARPDETLTSEGNGIVVLGRGDVVQLAFGSITATPEAGVQPITSSTVTAVPTTITVKSTSTTTPPTATSPNLNPTLIGGIIATLILTIALIIWLWPHKPNL